MTEFVSFEDLGKEMGESLKSEPFHRAQALWGKLHEKEARQKAQERFYKAAEAVRPLEETPKEVKKKRAKDAINSDSDI